MGLSLSDVQADLLGAFDRVLLMLDFDEAGMEAAPKIAAQLAPQCFVRIVTLPDGVTQPDQLSTEALRDVLDLFF